MAHKGGQFLLMLFHSFLWNSLLQCMFNLCTSEEASNTLQDYLSLFQILRILQSIFMCKQLTLLVEHKNALENEYLLSLLLDLYFSSFHLRGCCIFQFRHCSKPMWALPRKQKGSRYSQLLKSLQSLLVTSITMPESGCLVMYISFLQPDCWGISIMYLSFMWTQKIRQSHFLN